MGTDWYWTAAYVQNSTQQEVIRSIQTALEVVSDNNITLTQETGEAFRRYERAGYLFLCVSSTKEKWTAIWSWSNRLLRIIFETQALSGLLVSGQIEVIGVDADDEDVESDPLSCAWDMSLWSNGEIIEWAIHNPEYHFGNWDYEAVFQIVIPYLIAKGIDFDGEITSSSVFNQVEAHSDQFYFSSERFLELAHPLIKRDDLDRLLKMTPIPALRDLPRIFNIPFIGPEYYLADMAAYFDDEDSGYASFGRLEPVIQDEDQRREHYVPIVGEFKPLVVRIRDYDEYSFRIPFEYSHLFYY